MSISTLETLPDEILILIFQYSGSTINIFRAFLGLNQRFNHILLDRRLHLLTDYLSLKPLNVYYSSDEFQQVSRQLSTIRASMTEEKLTEILEPLYGYSIRQRYFQAKENFELLRAKFRSVRQTFSHDELEQVDDEIKNEFLLLRTNPVTSVTVQQFEELVLRRGARLECDMCELGGYNLASNINDWILCHINQNKPESKLSIRLYSQIIQTSLVSNPDLLNNRGYVGNGGCKVDFFLLYTLFGLKYFYGTATSTFVNVDCFQTTLDLFLLTLHCRSATDVNRYSLQTDMLDVLSATLTQLNDLRIQNVQFEIIKLIFERVDTQSFTHNGYEYTIPRVAKRLCKLQRFDVLKYFFQQVFFKNSFEPLITIRKCINSMTGNRTKIHMFSFLLNDPSTSHLFSQQLVLFSLLDKKEHKLLKELLRVSPDLINQLDDQGNDPLLYITLNILGCRHRIIETLIKAGCDPKRINANGQTFRDALQLPRNRKLFETLIEHEIIE